MKANEFVKKFGWDVAIKLSNEMAGITQDVADCIACWGQSEWDYLKRLVVSHELVESYGGLIAANKTICDAFHGSNHSIPDGHEELSLAIADVESCQ